MNINNSNKKQIFNNIIKRKKGKSSLIDLSKPNLLTIDNKSSNNNIKINDRSKNGNINYFFNYFQKKYN